MYPHLLSPFQVGKYTFKNRILGGPLGNNEDNTADGLSAHNIDYYGALARGGAARITTGDTVVSPEAGYNGGAGRLKLFGDPMELMNSVKMYANAIHRYDCLAFIQLAHNGGEYQPMAPVPSVSYGPSAMEFPFGARVIEMDETMMQKVCDDFALCISRAKAAGVDGVIIHGGHGAKLLDQFRSNLTNHRTDRYGGSVENRCRFPMMLMRAVREAAGDMLVELRISAQEYMDGGITTEESIAFLKMVEAEHLADIFHITGGRHVEPRRNAFCISPATFPPALFRAEAKKIRAAGIRTPLALINSLADPDIAEDVIASGDADFIVLSRQINLADPYYPRKLREGKPWLIDSCLRCHGCYDVTGPCSVNPLASYKTYESSYELPLAKTAKKVCIVGGGIAGLKAAFTAAERGHRVILFEKEAELGGQLRFADTDTFKFDIRRYKNNMIRRCELHPNIEIRLNTEATPELIEKELPCALIAAVGAEQKIPDIPGVDQANVIGVMDVYLHPEKLGERIIMVGSGLTACEVGLHLERTGKAVSIIGRRDKICAHETMFNEPPSCIYTPVDTFMDWFEERGIALYNNADVIAVLPEGVRIRDTKTGEERTVEGDTVVLAAGMCAKRGDALRFNDVGAFYFAMAGDCIAPKKIRDAVSTGYFAAVEL